jgi:hypothetical protein
MLFQALSSHQDLWSLYRESQSILDAHFPVSMVPGHSAFVSGDDVDDPLADAVERDFFDSLGNMEGAGGTLARSLPLILRARLSQPIQKLGRARKKPPVRMVEKTPDNCFRLQMLTKVFPDALFVYMVRDPRGSIASVYHGWKDEARFRRYTMPSDYKIGGYTGNEWCFGLTPGWEKLNGLPLIDICAHQWLAYNECCLRDLPEEPERRLTVRYEELASQPGPVLERLAEWADLDPAPLRRFRDKLPVVNTWTRPNDEKWRRFETEINSVTALIEPMSHKLGYELSDVAPGSPGD